MIRRATLIAIVPLSLAVAALFVGLASRSEGAKSRQSQLLHLSGNTRILNRVRLLRDHLPSQILELPVARHLGDTRAARLAMATSDERRYFVVPGAEGSLCLLFASGAGATFESGGTCAAQDELKTGSIYIAEPQSDGTLRVAGIVSDGVTFVSARGEIVTVANNFFELRRADRSVTLGGIGGERQLDLGPSAPASTVTASS